MTAKTALIVDDSKSARFALRRYLEGQQYNVVAVESAAEAMGFLATHRPEVIFLDHVMPGTDGFEALRILKADPDLAAIPVVICSSSEGPGFNARARVAGASGVLQKPPHPEQLTRILQSIATSAAVVEMPASPKIEPSRQAGAIHATPSAAPATTSTGAEGASLEGRSDDREIREQVDSRLKKISQGLLVQFAEIKATVGHLANQQLQLAESAGTLRSELRARLDENSSALRLVTSRIESLERDVFGQLTAMRIQMEATLRSHTERVSEIVQFARQAATEEAQVVAERTVMSAAIRLSDQISDAILGAVGRR